MSERIKPDDPAFPDDRKDGMTIRTWLAGQALAGLCAKSSSGGGPDVAETAAIVADRLIAKLNEGAQP